MASTRALLNEKTSTQNTTHLGPLRAAQKIFDSWCRHNAFVTLAPTAFVIQETTRGKQSKVFSYTGYREKLETPRMVNVTNKQTNKTHTIQYAYRSKVKALRQLVSADAAGNSTAALAKGNANAKGNKTKHAAKAAKATKTTKATKAIKATKAPKAAKATKATKATNAVKVSQAAKTTTATTANKNTPSGVKKATKKTVTKGSAKESTKVVLKGASKKAAAEKSKAAKTTVLLS